MLCPYCMRSVDQLTNGRCDQCLERDRARADRIQLVRLRRAGRPREKSPVPVDTMDRRR